MIDSHQNLNVHAHCNQQSTSADKIALFRSLFRGREDVYPRRFESRRTGKSGYSPACANEWVGDVCQKPAIKCADCPNRRFLPVTDETIRWHLSGRDSAGNPFTMGVYPMLLDESCFFLAADFDGERWCDDAAAVLDTCRQMGVSAAMERSRSGNGGHLWVFFREAIPATLVRKLGANLLTETMDRRPELGMKSYDRLFPNQDTMPTGGFGNLIALPLQKVPRDCGNSVFLDEQLQPHRDQWAHLATIQKIDRSEVEDRVAKAERRDRVVGVRLALSDDEGEAPWRATPSRRPPVDGVDEPLGNLFVHATRVLYLQAEGADRARSATEAFLYRRLESLAETVGRFHLNVELPIPFDGKGRMEVDLLCAGQKLVVEIDGAQHLGDPAAYRRDRRKDALLQEQGYFVLRVLAEDVGKRLDDVLDTILRALAHLARIAITPALSAGPDSAPG